MKIHFISDVHVEVSTLNYRKRPECDLVIAAGDIGPGFLGLKWLQNTWPDRPVVYVPGNHDYYGTCLPEHRLALKELAAGSSVLVVDRDEVVFGDVRMIGATLWTDFALDGSVAKARAVAEHAMSDYFEIAIEGRRRISTADVLKEHQADRAFIEATLAKPFSGKTLVVTHHAPSAFSLSERFLGDPLAPAFASDLEKLIIEHQPAAWIHGHVHQSVDFEVGRTKILANPRGYVRAGRTAGNAEFSETITLEI